MKVLSVVGARPQFVKLAPVSRALAIAGVGHTIVHTGQHYDARLSDAFFDDLGIPTADFHLGIGSAAHGPQTGAMLAALDPLLDEQRPDWALVYGDTNTTLAGALAAVKLHIPVAHLEAGLRSRNRRMPEEINRILTDHAADLCLAPTELAMQNLAAESLSASSVLVGDVMTDVCLLTRDRIREQGRKVPEVHADEPFVLATLHRAENTDDPRRLKTLLDGLAGLPMKVLLAVHPRLRDKAAAHGLELTAGSLIPVEPLSYPDLIAAVLQSISVVTDSGGLQKEAFLLETPCTTLRSETEWPETLAGGWNALCAEGENLVDMVTRHVGVRDGSFPYGRGDAAARVAAELAHRFHA